MEYFEMTNEGVLEELGARVQRKRLNRNMSQSQLADQAGVSRRTIYLIESGQPIGLKVFISILRALGSLGELDSFMPVIDISPIELAKMKGRVRQRASNSRLKDEGEK